VRLAAVCVFVIAALAASLTGCGAPEESVEPYAIVGATLMDGTAHVPVDNAVVIIRKGRIAAMGPASAVSVPNGIKRVSGRGRFVFPLVVDQPLVVDGTADLILCSVNPARDPEYMKKTAGRMEKGHWTQFPD